MTRSIRPAPAPLLVSLVAALSLAGCPTEEDPLAMAALSVEGNDGNVLSAWVRWNTDRPASSRVEFGQGGELRHFVEDGALTQEHALLALGFHPDEEVTLVAVSLDAEGDEVRSEPQTFMPAPLPFEPLDLEVTEHDPERTDAGWTLFDAASGSALFSRVTAVMVDMDGELVWYHDYGAVEGRADVEVNLLDDGAVLIGGGVPPGKKPREVELDGTVRWQGPVQHDDINANVQGMHHSFHKLPDGGYGTMWLDFVVGQGLNDRLDLFDADGNSLWTWETSDRRDQLLNEEDPQGNLALFDADEGVCYYNTRNHSAIYKIDMETDEVLWVFGLDGDFEMLSAGTETWFRHAHAPELLPGGGVLIYDNQGLGSGFSRAIEYAVDHDAMTAEVVWQYPSAEGIDDWRTSYWGDADRLSNGNTLITAGTLIDSDTPSRIMEITPDGDKVWQLRLSAGDELAGAYTAERIPALIGDL